MLCYSNVCYSNIFLRLRKKRECAPSPYYHLSLFHISHIDYACACIIIDWGHDFPVSDDSLIEAWTHHVKVAALERTLPVTPRGSVKRCTQSEGIFTDGAKVKLAWCTDATTKEEKGLGKIQDFIFFVAAHLFTAPSFKVYIIKLLWI